MTIGIISTPSDKSLGLNLDTNALLMFLSTADFLLEIKKKETKSKKTQREREGETATGEKRRG